jgi:hypothetical protein
MPLGALSQAWITAEAALPHGWAIVELEAEREFIQEDGRPGTRTLVGLWHARAIGLDEGDVAEGTGTHPAQALNRLADKLRELRGPVTG